MSRREERIHTLTEKALDAYARARAGCERRRGQPPQPGDVFVLAETADFPVEWAVVERDPEDPDRFLAVAVDLNPLVGSTDVAVPAETASGPLSIRCAVSAWLASERLESARRTALLEPDHLERVRRKRLTIEEGTPAGSLAAEATDDEPEYRDWVEVLDKARATLHGTLRQARGKLDAGPEAAAGAGPFFAFRRPAVRRVFGNPYVLAASLLLTVTLGFFAGIAWQHRQETLPAGEPLVNLPLVLLGPAGTVRGQVQTFTVPLAASHLLLLLEVNARYPVYRLEILKPGTPAPVWTSDALTRVGETELSVALPRRSFPAGEYRLRLHGLADGQADLLEEYALRLEVE